MSEIKSYSVGFGDMFYISHNSDNFTIIDCSMDSITAGPILDEIASLAAAKGIVRFISTHPDQDHIRGLINLDDRIAIANFYCVQNEATKPDPTADFERYCSLRDDTKKAFYLFRDCSRRWMNKEGEGRGSSGINILWPKTDNIDFQAALIVAADGGNANNICPIVRYAVNDGVSAVWFGDLETDFLERISSEFTPPRTEIMFSPHHGRDVVPAGMLKYFDPQVIVIGEAASEHLNYYSGWNTITQNSAGHVLFHCVLGKVHVYTGKEVSLAFLYNDYQSRDGYYYAGTFDTRPAA